MKNIPLNVMEFLQNPSKYIVYNTCPLVPDKLCNFVLDKIVCKTCPNS